MTFPLQKVKKINQTHLGIRCQNALNVNDTVRKQGEEQYVTSKSFKCGVLHIKYIWSISSKKFGWQSFPKLGVILHENEKF